MHYPDHGADWGGWGDYLPQRSMREIRDKAKEMGLRRSEAELAADPDEQIVMRLMESGMPPSEIDARMRWPMGRAREIASDAWLRDRQRARQ